MIKIGEKRKLNEKSYRVDNHIYKVIRNPETSYYTIFKDDTRILEIYSTAYEKAVKSAIAFVKGNL